jgi:hypothetical protein
VSYYLFEPCFTRVGEGHDKGGAESRGKNIRLQHFVPIPRGDSLQEISEASLREVEEEAASKEDGAGRPVTEKIEEERRHLRALPIRPFDPSRLVPVLIGLIGFRYALVASGEAHAHGRVARFEAHTPPSRNVVDFTAGCGVVPPSRAQAQLPDERQLRPACPPGHLKRPFTSEASTASLLHSRCDWLRRRFASETLIRRRQTPFTAHAQIPP